MNIIQQPDALSFSYNIRDFRISSTEAVSFVLKKGATELVAQTYEPGQDGYVTIKVRDIVHAQLAFFLKNISTVYEQPGIVADFTAVIDSTEVAFRVIRGGVDNFADTAANFLTENWLTWQPQEKSVTYSSPEFLTYYAVAACACKLKAYYTDESGTVTSEETITVATLTAGKAYTMPMQYAAVSALLSSKLPAFYDIWVENGSGSRLSYIQRYYAGNMKSEQEDWILFENSLGGIDTFRAYGVTDFTGEHTHNIAEIDEVSEEYRVDTERKYQKNTGYLNKRERIWLLDFFPSAHKMIYTSGALRTIVVTESDVTYKDKELPSSYTFTYKFADAKPLLNLTRASAPAEVLNIAIPDLGNFTVPPRLVELDSLAMTEGALFPVQSPYDEAWQKTTAGALFQYIADKLSNNYQGGGGIGHTHNNLDLLQLLTYVDEYLLVNGDKIKAGYADEIPDEIDKIITFLKGWITENYTSGLLGTGAGLTIDPVTGKTRIEADELFIRMKAYFYELVIETLTHVGGQIILTPARMTCIKVEELTNAYRCYFKATDGEKTITNDFIVGDQATAREFNVKVGTTTGATNHYFWRLVTGIGDDYIDLSKTDCDTNSDAPLAGDDIIALGHSTDITRQGAIVLSSVSETSPSIIFYQGINSFSLVNKEVIEFGYNKSTGKSYMRIYGDSYIGARDRSSYVGYTPENGVEIKAKLHIEPGSTGWQNAEGLPEEIQAAVELAQEAKDAANSNAEFIDGISSELDTIKNQIDGVIETWFYDSEPTLTNAPAITWTTDELKNTHLGDLYYSGEGKAYRFQLKNGVYSWQLIEDTDVSKALEAAKRAQDTADGKRRVFITQPTVNDSYDIGDLWVNATYVTLYNNDLLRCKTAKSAGVAFSITHWDLASRYTDDSTANEAINKINNLEVSNNNLLRNSGFTGDYVSKQLTGDSNINDTSEMFSPSLDHWDSVSATVQSSSTSQSGKEVVLSNGSLVQTLFYKLLAGESYIFSFRGKGSKLTFSCGGYSETITLTSEYKRCISKFKTLSAGTTFSITASTGTFCELQLERGTVASTWGASMLDNSSELAYYQSLQYISNAIKDGSVDILGGLALMNILMVGNYKNGVMQQVTGGISGIYSTDDDVAVWAGGTLEMAIRTVLMFKDNPNYTPTEAELDAISKVVITHGGRAILNDVVVRGIIYATGGTFFGSISTPFIIYRATTAGLTTLNLDESFNWYLANTLDGSVDVALPTDIKYNGVHAYIYNGSFGRTDPSIDIYNVGSSTSIITTYPGDIIELIGVPNTNYNSVTWVVLSKHIN